MKTLECWIPPTRKINKRKIVQVSAGTAHSLALKSNGKVYSWGNNFWGQLGIGSNVNSGIPVLIKSLSKIVQVSSGDLHSLALTSNGRVYSWGSNDSGQLGLGTTTDSNFPVLIPSLSNIVQISAGDSYSLALTSDGKMYSWGINNAGQLGVGTSEEYVLTPRLIELSAEIIQIEAGGEHSLGLTSDGKVYSWGSNEWGQLGIGLAPNSQSPTPIESLSNIVQVSASGHSLALTSDGKVYSWGSNHSGQLGDNSETDSYIPILIQTLTNIAQVSVGPDHSLATTADGKLYCWGSNVAGELGIGENATSEQVPVLNPFLSEIIDASGGGDFSLVLTSGGKVYSFGFNTDGQLGTVSSNDSNIPVLVKF